MATPDSLNKELQKVTQTTGFIAGGGLDTLQGRISSQIRTTNDIASIVHQLNVVYYNIVRTLTDGVDTGRENVLETGIAGTNIICYQDATEGSCYWADLLEKPATIKEVFDCVLGRISSLENSLFENLEVAEYDDSDLVARLDCIELNLLQIMKDTLGSGSYGCDGSNDFIYSLSSIINALGANFDGFTPIHVPHSEEGTPGPYTLSYYSSQIIWDVAVAQVNVENLPADLACIHDAIGMTASDDCNNVYSTEIPSAASAGNNVVADSDSLRQAIKALDGAVGGGDAWSEISFSTIGTGIAAGAPQIMADTAGDTIEFVAGDGIRIDSQDDPEQIVWSIGNFSLQDAYQYGAHGYLELNNTYPAGEQGISIVDNKGAVGDQLFTVRANSNPIYMRVGMHENFVDSVDYQTYRVDIAKSPFYLEPQEYVPATTGPGLLPPFDSTTRGAVWVSSGTASHLDKFGNPLVANHIYYREPNQGLIHDLTCCYYLSQGHETEDPATVNDPFETVTWTESPGPDTRLNRANASGTDPFLTYQEHPNNGGQVHFSIEVVDPTANDTSGLDGANYVAMNMHQSAVLFSKLSSATNIPETHNDQGALFVPNDGTVYNQTPVTAGRLYYRAPGNGDIYDLTSGGGGGAQNLFSSFGLDVEDGELQDSFPVKTAATATIHFHTDHPLDGETITITDTNGLTRTYTGSANGTDAANGLFAVNNSHNAIDGLDDCITHPNGHNGSITTNQPISDQLDLTQIAGVEGNTNIAHTFSQPGVTVDAAFTGGSSTDPAGSPTDTFTFIAGENVRLTGSDGSLEIATDLSQFDTKHLTDVSNNAPATNQVLVYDAVNQEYEPTDFGLATPTGFSGVELIGALTPGGGNTVKALRAASGKILVTVNPNNADIDIDLGAVTANTLSDVSAPAPAAEDALIWNGVAWEATPPSGYRRTATSVGTGEQVIKQVTDSTIELKSIKTNTTGMTISSTANEIYIDYAGGGQGGGENLSSTLAIGNDTNGQDIIISNGDEVLGQFGLTMKTGVVGNDSGDVEISTSNATTISGDIGLFTGTAGPNGRGRLKVGTSALSMKFVPKPENVGALWGSLFIADNSTAGYREGGLYYLTEVGAVQREVRLDAAPLDTEHVNMPEAPGDTVYHYGWTSRPCNLVSAEVFCHAVNTQGTYTLVIQKYNGAVWTTMLSSASFDMNTLAANTVTSLTLTGTAADLELGLKGAWRIGLQSNNPGMDAEAVYVRLAFEAK